MSPEAIVRDDIAKAVKDKTENTKIVESAASKKDEIRLKGHCLLATKSEINKFRVENKNENFRLPGTVFEILLRFWCKRK